MPLDTRAAMTWRDEEEAHEGRFLAVRWTGAVKNPQGNPCGNASRERVWLPKPQRTEERGVAKPRTGVPCGAPAILRT